MSDKLKNVLCQYLLCIIGMFILFNITKIRLDSLGDTIGIIIACIILRLSGMIAKY